MSNVVFDFTERTVVVTGAASGIGRAAAAAFGTAGADVYLLDLDREAGVSAAAGVGTFLACDVTDPTAISGAMATIGEAQGRIDVLVNNAGGFREQRTVEDTGFEDWHKVLDLNLTSPFLVTRAAIPLLRRSGSGRVINIGSLAGQVSSYRTSPPYAAAKAGLHALTRVLAHELAAAGIVVNALAPSAVMTERIEAVRDAAERDATARTIPLGRYQRPQELAAWVLFLASEEAGYATGQTFGVNGGRYMG